MTVRPVWTDSRRAELLAIYPTRTVAELAEHFGCSVPAIRTLLWKLAAPPKTPRWTEEDIEILRFAYSSTTEPIRLDALAARLGRHKSNVSRKARSLGLTDYTRVKDLSTERRATVMKAWHADHEHPRGMLGKKHSTETVATLGAHLRRRWAEANSLLRTPAMTAARAATSSARIRARIAAGTFHPYSRAKRGRRADLGNVFFRSRWEANYARFLNLAVQRGGVRSWEYEPRTFVFPKPEPTVTSYTPDFRVVLASGVVEWHEVKGWLDAKSKLRRRMMREQFPGEVVRLVRETFFKNCIAQGIAALLPGWEHAGSEAST